MIITNAATSHRITVYPKMVDYCERDDQLVIYVRPSTYRRINLILGRFGERYCEEMETRELTADALRKRLERGPIRVQVLKWRF